MDEKKVALGKGAEISFKIPPNLAEEFGKELRVIIRFPWLIGIPIPERFLKQELFKELLKDFDVMITPKQLHR